MGARTVFLWCAAGVCALAASSSASGRSGSGVLRIESLRGSVERIGSGRSGLVYGLRLRATVCARSPAEARKLYPSEIRITHFAVSKSPTRWWPARTVIDRAPWLVPIGETWGGKACGALVLHDPIPPEHYGVESLGNPQGCYGAALMVRAAGGVQASRRAIVKCGRRFG